MIRPIRKIIFINLSEFIIFASFYNIMTAAVRIIAPLVFLAVCLSAKGQSVDYDYYPYAREQADRLLQTDSVLLYRPSAAQDLFSDIVRYVPHPVRFRSRGASYKDDLLAVDGLRLSDAATHAAPYAVVSALYASFAQCRKDAFVADNATGRSGNISLYKSSPTDNLTEATRISLRLTDKSYRFGLRGQTGFIFGNGKWEAALSADMKYGPDSHAGGVFTSSAGYALSIRRPYGGRCRHFRFHDSTGLRRGHAQCRRQRNTDPYRRQHV